MTRVFGERQTSWARAQLTDDDVSLRRIAQTLARNDDLTPESIRVWGWLIRYWPDADNTQEES